MSDGLQRRGRALEESFFNRLDQQLLAALRADADNASKIERLSAASGIEHSEVLAELASAGIQPETIAALALVPLIQVAWADGSMDDKEKQAILASAADDGMQADSPAYQLLEQWLAEAPTAELTESWQQYVGALYEDLSAEAMVQIKDQALARARRVAEAAGGFLGLGNKVNSQEQAVLDELASAFN